MGEGRGHRVAAEARARCAGAEACQDCRARGEGEAAASRASDAARAKPTPKPAHVPRAAPLDRQTSRQLDKGKLEVEARLDLHGMRQRDAHAQLRRFLKTAQARGLKHVLVITGKGVDQTAS